ncbi:hypothetical protein BC829DRAFT_432479 [Chytridium lagenaria]|nr:hypothetical protein BC829DRAFT_432479 [Chytridium lagenaria]
MMPRLDTSRDTMGEGTAATATATSTTTATTTTTTTPTTGAQHLHHTSSSATSSLNGGSIPPSPSTPIGAKRRMHLRLLNQGLFRFQDVFWGTGQDPTEGVTALHSVFTAHLAEAEDLIAIAKARVEVEEFTAAKFAEVARIQGASSSSISSSPSSSVTASAFYPTSLLFGGSALVNGEWVAPSAPAASASKEASAMMGGGGIASSDFGSIPTEVTERRHRRELKNLLLQKAKTAMKKKPGESKTNDEAAKEKEQDVDTASLNPVLQILRSQMMAMAACHRRHADTLTLAVLTPLTAFVDQHRRALSKKKAEVDSTYRELQRIASDIDPRKNHYLSRSKVAEDEEFRFRRENETPRPNPLTPITFGSRSVGMQEFHDIVNALKKEVRFRSILTPVGLFEGCFIGEDAVKCLQAKYPKVPKSDIRHLCQELIERRAIAAVVGGKEGKFSKALPYMFGRPLLKSGEPPHVKARKDAEVARLEYQAVIDSAEHTRGALEFHITDYLVAAQEAEIYRLSVAKEALAALESAQIIAVNGIGTCWASPSTGAGIPSVLSPTSTVDNHFEGFINANLLVSPDAAEGVQGIASRYRTGHVRLSPYVFESYEEGRTPRQVFGIGMEELAKSTGMSVPAVVIKSVACLLESLRAGRSSIDTWIAPNPDLPAVQFLRHEMNRVDEGVKTASMKRHMPAVVAGVLRLYLVEAPVSLCSYELYEPLKMLYDDDHENFDVEVRLKSVQSLLATLSPPHFETLQILMAYLHELVQPLEPFDERIPRLCWSLAPTILRPKQETKETLADEHPWKFTPRSHPASTHASRFHRH